jgi:hypothetical protein
MSLSKPKGEGRPTTVMLCGLITRMRLSGSAQAMTRFPFGRLAVGPRMRTRSRFNATVLAHFNLIRAGGVESGVFPLSRAAVRLPLGSHLRRKVLIRIVAYTKRFPSMRRHSFGNLPKRLGNQRDWLNESLTIHVLNDTIQESIVEQRRQLLRQGRIRILPLFLVAWLLLLLLVVMGRCVHCALSSLPLGSNKKCGDG